VSGFGHTPGFFFGGCPVADRAVLFIDGNNWYHSLAEAGVGDLGRLNYARVSEKLVGPRTWIGTRYYIGQVQQKGNPRLYADQRRFLSYLKATDPRISVHLGRLEERQIKNEAALELRQYLSSLPVRIDVEVFHGLMDIAKKHAVLDVMVEKAVDVMLAVDLVMMAQRDEFDAAYLLSADGDYTPAVVATANVGKTVYAFSPAAGAQLGRVVKAFIRPKADWFDDCY
jgi:uncharacterized LabA/DUF88 family protein